MLLLAACEPPHEAACKCDDEIQAIQARMTTLEGMLMSLQADVWERKCKREN